MMHFPTACRRSAAVLAAALLAAAGAPGADLAAGPVSLTVAPDGGGFVDGLSFRGRIVSRAAPGFDGATLALVAPAAAPATLDGLAAETIATVLTGRVTRVERAADGLAVEGSYTAVGAPPVPFSRRYAFEPGGHVLRISETTDYGALPAGWRVAQHALRLPLAVTNDPHLRMFGFGCSNRTELFRMDMNDLTRRMQLLSAPRAHWPFWDLGGVLQLPGCYRVWKANHADTPAYPLQEGPGAPGWADYSEFEWGLTAQVDAPGASAPWGIAIDARRGTMTVEPWPACVPSVAGADRGRRTFVLRLTLHDTSWPATVPCELDFATYRALLADVGDYIASPIGTGDPDAILFRERLQPSTVLRLLYRGDAWRMQGRLAAAGISVPRAQPMEKWEADAQRYLEYVRAHGVPPRAGKK